MLELVSDSDSITQPRKSFRIMQNGRSYSAYFIYYMRDAISLVENKWMADMTD